MSTPLPDHRLLLRIVLQMLEPDPKLGTPIVGVENRHFGRGGIIVLNVQIPPEIYRIWESDANAPYGPDDRAIDAAIQRVERDMLDWMQILEGEARARADARMQAYERQIRADRERLRREEFGLEDDDE